MSEEHPQTAERLAIALECIAAEQVARTGRLDLSSLGLPRLPAELSELDWLFALDLSDDPEAVLSPLSDLSPLAVHSGLRLLSCSQTKVTDLSPLATLTSLESIDCSNTQVADLSPLAALSALRYLHCAITEVADLIPLAGLTKLDSLDCWATPVADLSPLARLTALQSLGCSQTQVADLTPLAGLTALESLDCSYTLVADLAPLAGLTALRSLDCSSTQVADLSPLAGLTALQSLDCGDTQVADLSPLAGLTALGELKLWGAPIAALPDSIIDLPGLKELFIDPGPGLAEYPAEVLSRNLFDNCLPRLRAHRADLASGAVPLRDLKVIILGNGRIGKTQICRRLRGELFEPDADSTHGISVASVELPMPNGEDAAILNLWDFGGQDIYHGTHALFMRTRAVFLLVWTPGSEDGEHEHGGMVFRNRPLPYWLEYIRHLGGESSPVILVQNQCDGGRGERANLPVDAELIRPFEEDGRFFTRLAYSAKDDTGRARLMDALQLAVTGLREVQGRPLIGRNRLAVWDQLRAWRDADAGQPDESGRRHRLLPYGDFEALCRAHAVHSPETFAEVLHHAGMVFYRRGLFGDRLVLDQSWALNAVYALFTREGGVYTMLRRLGGRFTRSDLDALLWRGRGLSMADQGSLLEMMVTSGVCFVHRNESDGRETEYVAPELLPEGRASLAEELAARWDPLPGEALEAAFVYPFLSPSIARAVLSELGTLAGDTALYWRYGICLYDAASRASAICEEVPDTHGYGGQVRVQAKGAGARTLLRGLVERIGKLNERSGWANRLLESELPRPGAVPAPAIAPATPPATPPAGPEVYVSFAWARERTDPLVGALCDALAVHGLRVLRDSTELLPGDRISRFMERLSAGRCVLVVLSHAYLRSEYCMTELHGIWTQARGRGDEFLSRIVPLVQEDAGIGSPRGRIAHAVYWKREHDALADLIREHGAEVVGAADFARFKLIGDYYRHVGDMLALANDVLVARDRPTLARDGFALVRGLIERALG